MLIGIRIFHSQAGPLSGSGSGGLTNVQKIGVDASTPPGTNPVVANASNQINVTGGQVAAGTTTNVIRTDSLSANTFTIEVQRSQAVAVSTIGDNGVSHFNSAQFTVDGNGFVSLVGGATAIEKVNVQTGTSPVVPSGGAITVNGTTVAAGVNPVRSDGTGPNTLAIEVQTSQAIASSNATNIGLAAFNSADFTVDANGFVSILPQSLNYTSVTGPTTYTVLTTDYYISCDSSAGGIVLQFPNAPTFKQVWIVKDRTGSASTNNIIITTPGGAVTIDGGVNYFLKSNFAAVNLLANATPTYEVW